MVLDNRQYVFPIANTNSGGNIETQAKSVTITQNGSTRVLPDSGKTLSSVTITVDVQSATNEFPIVINAALPSVSWQNNTLTLDRNTIPQLEKITANSNILLYPNEGSGEKFFDSGITISSISDGEIVLSRTIDGGDLSIQVIILN